MGCIASKQAVSVTPAYDCPATYGGSMRERRNKKVQELEKRSAKGEGSEMEESGRGSSAADSVSMRLGNLHRYIEGEQVAAGWPAWLTAVAREAIQGWVPLKADSFEKLEKIGQGTYSSVFRARDLDTGKIVALKKVRFDNFEPESVRFMAREIHILRKLDHPNVIKLEGLITSRLSCSIYLVFEYMEHDLVGLSSCPDINFSESQVKCYMQQLLSGIEHCHSRGVMHRDIKGSNLLLNNEGILKVADFGLANHYDSAHRQPLTSRVVTLWYRPPELLLGSTDYGASVDLWSVGCVFAELLLGKPILQGRTEVEQLHKIFKLCGSPPDEYWKKSRLPHATIFKPQQPYESSLRETCKGFPPAAMSLIEKLLSVEPYKRGTVSSALSSEYFTTKPYACNPSTLPKYPPNKEIDAKCRDAKIREESRRRKACSRAHISEEARRAMRASRDSQEPVDCKSAAATKEICIDTQVVLKDKVMKVDTVCNEHSSSARLCHVVPAVNPPERKALHSRLPSQVELPFSGPLHVPVSSGFAWAAKRRVENAPSRLNSRSSSRGLDPCALDASNILASGRVTPNSKKGGNRGILCDTINSRGSLEMSKLGLVKQWTQFERPESFDASDMCHSKEWAALYQRDEWLSKRDTQEEGERVEFSGPVFSHSDKVDELLAKHERHIRQVVRKFWFQKVRKQARR